MSVVYVTCKEEVLIYKECILKFDVFIHFIKSIIVIERKWVIRFQWDPIASPTTLYSDTSIVRQSHKQHKYNMRGISTFLLFSFKLTEETLKCILYKVIHTM